MKYLSLKIFFYLAAFFLVLSIIKPVKVFASSLHVYVANSKDNTISVIDGITNSIVATIPVGSSPLGVISDPFNHEIYVANIDGHSVSVIDSFVNAVIKTISLGNDDPESFALSKDGKLLYIAAKNANKVDIINTSTNSLINTITGFVYPQHLVLNSSGTRLYVVSTNNPCCSSQNGYVSVIDTSNNTLIAKIPVGISPVGIALTPDGSKAYVANNDGYSPGFVSVIDTNLNSFIRNIPVGVNPFGVIVNTSGTRVYVTNTYFGSGGYNDTVNGTVSVIDTATDSVIDTIPVGYVPNILDISGDDSTLYVANTGGNPPSNIVSVIDTATDKVTATITVGNAPWGVAVDKSSATSPADVNLSVPLLKQYDLPWGIQEYDSANMWSPKNLTIARWGCSLTSATMILEYYGIKKLPSGVTLDPGSLNTWLKNEKDGYVGDGLLNWIAIQRLSKQAASVNNISSFDALMYKRKNSEDISTLTSNLESGIPGILQEVEPDGGAHFIVAKGVSNNTFLINDPYFHWTTLSEGYNNHFSNVGWYTPSHTDLSYILLVTDPDVKILLKDENGNTIAESFIQKPSSDDTSGGSANARSVSMLYYPTPNTGVYDINISSTNKGTHTFKVYAYDVLGGVNILENSTNIIDGESKDFSLYFNKIDTTKNFETENFSSFFSKALLELSENYWLGYIDSGSFSSLSALLNDAQKKYLSGQRDIAKTKITDAQNLLRAKEGKGVSETSYYTIYSDLTAILTSL